MCKIECAPAKLLFVNKDIFFAVLLAVAVVVVVVIQKYCYHGNVTSHFSSLLGRSQHKAA